jgi:hypothetical protein
MYMASVTRASSERMSGLYNFTQSLDPSFNIMTRGFPAPTPNVGGGYPGGRPNMSSNPMNPGRANKAFMQGTNGSVKITVTSRNTDPKRINSAMLAFIDNSDFDRPTLMSLQQVNKFIVQHSTPQLRATGGVATFAKDRMFDTKKEIMDRFKLLGVVSNNDVDTDERVFNGYNSYNRAPRTFTIVTWGDSFLLNYWSNRSNTVRPYDDCYLVLKRVFLKKSDSFQTDVTQRMKGAAEPMETPIDYDVPYWQWIPVSCKGILPSKHLVNEYEDKDGVKQFEIGSYLRVGKIHEYGDIGSHNLYSSRDENSVSRDIAHLHENGKVRPFQFYLHLDDETRLV